MKKIIIAIVAVAVVAAAAVGGYFAFFADKGAEDETLITARKDEFMEDAALLNALAVNPDRYKASLAKDYAMGDEKAAEFFEAPENWLAYTQLTEVTNTSEENITVYGFEVKDNGKNGVYINTDIGGEFGLAPGGAGPVSFSVIFENGDLSIEEAQALVDEFEISVVYSKSPVEYDDGTESVEEKKTALIDAPVA